MSNPCIILCVTNLGGWGPVHGCQRIPAESQPTVLHPNRQIAEMEAQRLARTHPGQQFAVLEAQVLAKSTEVPTHVTLTGVVLKSRVDAVLLNIDEDEVPF